MNSESLPNPADGPAWSWPSDIPQQSPVENESPQEKESEWVNITKEQGAEQPAPTPTTSTVPAEGELRHRNVPGQFRESIDASAAFPATQAATSGAETFPPQAPAAEPSPLDGQAAEQAAPPPESQPTEQSSSDPPPNTRTYPPRTCRICLEVVHPTYHIPVPTEEEFAAFAAAPEAAANDASANGHANGGAPSAASLAANLTQTLPAFLRPAPPQPRVTYDSSDPSLGRLIRPCRCKGTARYVHEACLQTWRYADPAFGQRTYYACPTCGFRYRLQRVSWGRAINSAAAQVLLTLLVFALAVFALGFVADPIIDLYLDPYEVQILRGEAVAGGRLRPVFERQEDGSYVRVLVRERAEPVVRAEGEGMGPWTEHFIKGLASLGLLGFVKVIFAMSPWQWMNLRQNGIYIAGGGRHNQGRERVTSLTFIMIAMGLGTFLWGVYKGVRAWSRRMLEKASEKVMDVHLDDDDDELVEEEAPPAAQATAAAAS